MELKDILKTLDLEDVKDIDSFKEKFKSKFITKEEALNDDEIKGKITGKVTGAATTLFKRTFELDNADIKDKKWEEILEVGVGKLKAKMKELEEQGGKSNDEALKDLQAKYDKTNKALSEHKDLLSQTQLALQDREKEWDGKFKGLKIENIFKNSRAKLSEKLVEMKPLEKEGFESAIKQNIQIELDEKDEIIVKGPDGKRLANPNKIGSFLSLDEALELTADKYGVLKKNNAGSNNNTGGLNLFAGQQQNQQQQNNPPANGGNQRQIHPAALAQQEKLRAQQQQK